MVKVKKNNMLDQQTKRKFDSARQIYQQKRFAPSAGNFAQMEGERESRR